MHNIFTEKVKGKLSLKGLRKAKKIESKKKRTLRLRLDPGVPLLSTTEVTTAPVWIHACLRVSVEGRIKLSEFSFCAKMKRKLHCRVGVPSHLKEVTKLPLLSLESRATVALHACHMKP